MMIWHTEIWVVYKTFLISLLLFYRSASCTKVLQFKGFSLQ